MKQEHIELRERVAELEKERDALRYRHVRACTNRGWELVAELRIVVAIKEHRVAKLQEERDELREKVAELEAERDEWREKAAGWEENRDALKRWAKWLSSGGPYPEGLG
jgi:cell division protein FtsB